MMKPMKARILASVLALALALAIVLPAARATEDVLFSGLNNKLFPLQKETMPRYFSGVIYMPYTFFSSDDLGIYFASNSSEDTVLIYSSTKRLMFDVKTGAVTDHEGNQLSPSAKKADGIVYVPLWLVCSFFGLEYSVITAEPADIIRVKSGSNVLNDRTFASFYKPTMQSYYDEYMGIAQPTPATPSSPAPTETPPETYPGVTLFLGFFALDPGRTEAVLQQLSSARYRACFFATAEDARQNGDLLRRIAAGGHTIGVWLKEGTFEEYEEAARLIFEAVKIEPLIVSSEQASREAAAAMAQENKLIYWSPTRRYEKDFTLPGFTSQLSTRTGTRESVFFACSEKTVSLLSSILSYLRTREYTVRRITETSAPTVSVG